MNHVSTLCFYKVAALVIQFHQIVNARTVDTTAKIWCSGGQKEVTIPFEFLLLLMKNKTAVSAFHPTFKILILGLLCTSLLSGCFNFSGTTGSSSSGNQTSVDEQHKLYETNVFSVVVPKTWDVYEKDDFTSDVPEETIVVFRNNVKNENFTANVNIVQNGLQQPIALLDYAKMVSNRQRSGLYDYKETKKEEVKMKIGTREEPSYIIMFEAKKSPDEKIVRYIQAYAISGNSAYIITGAISTQENDNVVKTIEDIVKSFKLK